MRCEVCGTEFEPDKRHPQMKYCSGKCRVKGFRARVDGVKAEPEKKVERVVTGRPVGVYLGKVMRLDEGEWGCPSHPHKKDPNCDYCKLRK